MSGEPSSDEGYIGPSFLSMSPVRRQQTLPPPNEKELPPVPTVYKFTFFPYSTSTPTVNYIKRISFFVLFELGFIILASVSIRKPIFIGFLGNIDEAKGGFTILFILWQTIAVLPLQHIIFCIFSHEWSIRWSGTPMPLQDPHRIDQVSVLTSNFAHRARYVARGDSSNGFKLAFATSLALISLVKLGPGAVGIVAVWRNREVSVTMGKIALTNEVPTGPSSSILQRAQMIVGLEQLMNSQYGLDVPPNHIVSWPMKEYYHMGAEMSYQSDIVTFNYTCRWEIPTLSGEANLVHGGGIRWMVGQADSRISPNGGIIPVAPVDDTALSAYLFYGSNTTYGTNNTEPQYVLDLGSISSLVNATEFRDPQFSLELNTPLLSMLICDPRAQVAGGWVRLAPNGSLSVEATGLPPVGNIPQPAANFLFSRSLLTGTQQTGGATQDPSYLATLVSSRIFLTQSDETNSTSVYKPLSLDVIEKNVGAFLLSASKAFVDGYSPGNETSSATTFTTVPTRAIIREEVMALTASETFLIITIVLSLFVVILMTALCTNVPDSFQLFNLGAIIKALEESPRILRDGTETS